MKQTRALHQPVMLEQVLEWLKIRPDQWYLDATFGRGGHTRAILQQKGQVVALDFDSEAIKYGKEHYQHFIQTGKLILIRRNFDQLQKTLGNLRKKNIVHQVSAILFDFGTSVDQLKSKERGFSFATKAPLDMRMDQKLGVTAADLLNLLSEKQLSHLFWQFGGEKQARSIARAIKKATKPLTTTEELASLIIKVKGQQRGKLHPATKVFQALRIAVNTELDNIAAALPQAIEVLPTKGRLLAISFHEGEDKLVKQAFKTWQTENRGKMLTKKPLTPTAGQVDNNPRARSAKLRVFEKI